MIKHTVKLLSLSLISSLVLVAPVSAAKPPAAAKSSSVVTGNDIAWPQCGRTLPAGQLFGIVGVNDGLANNTNPCFTTELAWANNSAGGTGQAKATLYVNTANPGNLGVADWPTGGTSAKYGPCQGGDDQACAYQYGQNMAQLDTGRIGSNSPASFKWWLDVETTNSWETNTANNTADLEGMTDYFHGIGAQVGVYSTGYQWGQIAGTVPAGSSLNGLDSWLPGARSLKAAQSNCHAAPLTPTSKVSVTQYVSGSLDYDYSCV